MNDAIQQIGERLRGLRDVLDIPVEDIAQLCDLDIDTYLKFDEITPEFLSLLNKFNPFGPGNQKPIFCSRNVLDFGTSKLVGRNLEHIKLELVDNTSAKVLNGIAFNMAEHFEHIKSGKPFDICYTIEENKHPNNVGQFQLFVKEIRISK